MANQSQTAKKLILMRASIQGILCFLNASRKRNLFSPIKIPYFRTLVKAKLVCKLYSSIKLTKASMVFLDMLSYGKSFLFLIGTKSYRFLYIIKRFFYDTIFLIVFKRHCIVSGLVLPYPLKIIKYFL